MEKSEIIKNTFIISLFLIMFISMYPSQEEQEFSDLFQKELAKKETWLISETEDIVQFLDDKKSSNDLTNRVSYFSFIYVSPEFNKNKLNQLYQHMINKGWLDISEKIPQEFYIIKSSSQSEETARHTRILCKDKATIFMYFTDMQNDYIIDAFKARTLIEFEYSYNLPCYDFDE